MSNTTVQATVIKVGVDVELPLFLVYDVNGVCFYASSDENQARAVQLEAYDE